MKRLITLLLTFNLFCYINSSPTEAACFFENDCLKYVSTDHCRSVISKCIEDYNTDAIKSIACCNEQNCGRSVAKPVKYMDRVKEFWCIYNCLDVTKAMNDMINPFKRLSHYPGNDKVDKKNGDQITEMEHKHGDTGDVNDGNQKTRNLSYEDLRLNYTESSEKENTL